MRIFFGDNPKLLLAASTLAGEMSTAVVALLLTPAIVGARLAELAPAGAGVVVLAVDVPNIAAILENGFCWTLLF